MSIRGPYGGLGTHVNEVWGVVSQGQLLERERELSELEDLAAEVVSGSGRTIVIEGRPGVGKSTLITAGLSLAARHPGLRTASFRCGELELELSWAAVTGLLGRLVADLGAATDELFAGAAAPARRLFTDPVGTEAASTELDGFGVIHAVFALVSALAGDVPLLIALDDAHWADEPSLQFLTYLQRRLTDLPIGLVIATRPPSVGAESDLLERIVTGPKTRVQSLAPLAEDSVTTLVHAQGFPQAGPGFCHACWEVTAGNPFYLHELLLELREDRIDPSSGAAELMRIPPPSVTRSVLVRLGRLHSPHAGDLARASAVLGDGASLRHACALAGVDIEAGADALDALGEAELLTPGEPLRFVHPLVRAAVYSDIPEGRRALQHARAAQLLAADHAPAELVALHHLHAPFAASRETVGVLRAAAGRASANGAPAGAVRYLLRAFGEPPPAEDRAAILVELAAAERAVGDRAAVEHLTAALELTGEPDARACLYLALGWAEHDTGRFDRAADAFERGMALTTSAELAGELEAGFLMSATLVVSRVEQARERIQTIEELSGDDQHAAHRELLAQVLFQRTVAGAPRDGIIELAERLWAGGGLLADQGAGSQALWHVVGALSWADAYPQSLNVIDQVLSAADELGNALVRAQAWYARSWPYLWMGRVNDAARDARGAIEIWQGGMERYLPAAIYYLGLAELERDEPEAAAAALALAGPPERWEGTGMLPFLIALEGYMHAHAGRPVQAAARHLACGDTLTALMVASPAVLPWRSQAALALQLNGEAARARDLLDDELERALATGGPRPIGIALRASGLCLGGAGGLAQLQESVDVLDGSGADLELARSLVELGATIRRQARPRAARPYLERALKIMDGSGARMTSRRADTELRAAGGRGRAEPGSGPRALTASERRVAELAADGHTNRHIAAVLQVSVKAVEWHLHQSYRKLEIDGRRQLGDALSA